MDEQLDLAAEEADDDATALPEEDEDERPWRCSFCGEEIPQRRRERHEDGLDRRAIACPLQDVEAIRDEADRAGLFWARIQW